jgi:hypothetical protein
LALNVPLGTTPVSVLPLGGRTAPVAAYSARNASKETKGEAAAGGRIEMGLLRRALANKLLIATAKLLTG